MTNKTTNWLALFIITNAFLCLRTFGEDAPPHDVALKSFSISKNFRGFSYIFESPEKKPNQIIISTTPGDFEGKVFSGIILDLAGDGKIQEISPYLKIDNSKIFNPLDWAYSAFKHKKLTISGLWEVVRATTPLNIPDSALLRAMIFTIETTKGYPSLESIVIPHRSGLSISIDQIKKDRKMREETKTGNLKEVQEVFEL
jgi:hypothetical protein